MPIQNTYQVCSNCIMDTTDEEITFDDDGVCNHCIEFDTIASKGWYPNEEGERSLLETIGVIKEAGKDQEYDCILGLSGGVDSSYLAVKMFEYGLRPLVVHVDAGWNSELAVKNIESVVSYCNFNLHTHVVDWEEMRDLHLAYLRSGISNQDVPQDHVFFSSLYHFSIKHKIRYILSGGNLATEGIMPGSWHGGSAMDAINLKAIHKQFGCLKLKQYSTISFLNYYFWYPIVKGMRTVRPLNYMPYNKELAINELTEKTGWRSYGRKHGESIFTKIFQNYYLPQKFGYDKRLPHLSSLIVSGQMSREDALKKVHDPLYDEDELEIDIEYLCKKLRISREEFYEFLKPPGRYYSDFKNWDRRYRVTKWIQKMAQKILGKKINIYS